MTGFEFAQMFDTDEEKVSVLLLDAIKTAYSSMGINFDDLAEEQKMEIINKVIKEG